jgi:ribonuclease HI
MQVVVYTNASFCRRSGAAGWAFLLRHPLLGGEVEASGSYYTKDNNEPEWMAVESACRRLLETGVPDANVTVYTDSEFCLGRFDPARLLAAGAHA